jgi:hypothetical protein
MASSDERVDQKHPIARIEVPQITLPNGASAEVTETLQNVNLRVKQIAVTVNDNTGNATMTVQLRDNDGAVLWSEAGIAENAITVFQYYTLSDTDLPLCILLQGAITVGVTPSGDPGASTGLVDVKLYGD